MQSFLRILKVAVLVNFFISLVVGLAASFAEREPLYFLYVGILLFGSLFFPLIIASCLHYFIDKKINTHASFMNFLLQSVILIVAFQIGLVIWTIIEVVLDFTLENAVNHYNREFGSMFWLTVLIAFAIPLTAFFLDKRSKSKDRKLNNSGAQN